MKNPSSGKPIVSSPTLVAIPPKEGPVEIVVIADRSGSMATIADDAIGGFNTFLKEQQGVDGEANLTLVLFDDQYEVPVKQQPIREVKPLTNATYVPRGTTAMNDAICRAINDLNAVNPAKAIVCILTDGYENASREHSAADVKSRIQAAEARGWQVVYLAANQDAFAVGATLGVLKGNTQNIAATPDGIRTAYMSMSTRASSYRTGEPLDQRWGEAQGQGDTTGN